MRIHVSFAIMFAPIAFAATEVERSRWELIEPKAPGKAPVLTFDKGRFGIRICNNIGGPAKLDGSHLAPSNAISTMMACANPDLQKLETSLSAALTKNQSFAIEGDRLTLTGPAGEKFLFQRALMPSAAAKTKFIYVASTLRDCTGVAPMKCMQIRDSKDQPWRLHYSQIIGFEFVPGIEYRLRIKEDKVANPPADASSLRWFLDMIVEQKVVDRQAAEAYEAAKPKL